MDITPIAATDNSPVRIVMAGGEIQRIEVNGKR
jgi:hypothetical protein